MTALALAPRFAPLFALLACADGPKETGESAETDEPPPWAPEAMTDFAACGRLRGLAMDAEHRDYLYVQVPSKKGVEPARTDIYAVGEGGVTVLVELDLGFDADTACASIEEIPPFGARWWRATEGTVQVVWTPGDTEGDGRLGEVEVSLSQVVLESAVSPPEAALAVPAYAFTAPYYVDDLPA